MNEETKCTLEELHAKAEDRKNPQSKYESDELGKLFEALAKAQSELEVAKEDSKNPFFKSFYSGLASVIKSSRPYLSKHDLCVIQRIMANGNKQSYLFTRLAHTSGQWIESRMQLLPTKPDMQGMGSAITYAKRYAYAAIVGVVTGEDDDGNGACKKEPTKEPTRGKECISKSEAQNIIDLITASKDESLLDKMLNYYKINKLSSLEASSYEECIKNIKSYGVPK